MTLATPSMRPTRRPCGTKPGPGKVSRVAKLAGSAAAKRDRPTAIPLVVTHCRKVRRDARMVPPQVPSSLASLTEFGSNRVNDGTCRLATS